jgi:hypothetical protein
MACFVCINFAPAIFSLGGDGGRGLDGAPRLFPGAPEGACAKRFEKRNRTLYL